MLKIQEEDIKNHLLSLHKFPVTKMAILLGQIG